MVLPLKTLLVCRQALYSVTVSDATNCSSIGHLPGDRTVWQPLAVETITPVLCGEANGSIDLEVTPPTGNSFNWSDGSTTEDLNNILPGQYTVTVTSQNGCVWSSGFNVPGSEKLEIELQTDIIQTGDAFVTIRAQVNVPLTCTRYHHVVTRSACLIASGFLPGANHYKTCCAN